MKHVKTSPFSLERLEGRVCPALTVRNLPGLLQITGTPNSLAAPLQINQVGGANNNLFQILDGAANLGTYRVNNLTVQLQSRRADIEVELNGGRVPGNLTLSLGNGFVGAGTSTIELFSTAAGGRIGGTLTLLGGNGREQFDVGSKAGNLLPVTIGGNLVASARAAATPTGDTLTLHGDEVAGAGSVVGGTLQAVNVDNVFVGDANADGTARVGGDLVVTVAGPHGNTATNVFGQVGRNVSVSVPSGTSGFNQFTFDNQTVTTPSLIGGNLSVSLGATGVFGNLITLQTAAGAVQSTISGNVTLRSLGSATGATGDSFVVNAAIAGSALIDLGEGDNFLDGDVGLVAGSLRVLGGNGSNFVGTLGLDGFDVEVAGDLSFQLGNGDHTAVLTNAPGGVLSWVSGNGTNLLTLGTASTAAGSFWRVDLRFGTGDDTLTLSALAPPTQTISGRIDLGGGTNTFNQDGWVIVPTTTIIA